MVSIYTAGQGFLVPKKKTSLIIVIFVAIFITFEGTFAGTSLFEVWKLDRDVLSCTHLLTNSSPGSGCFKDERPHLSGPPKIWDSFQPKAGAFQPKTGENHSPSLLTKELGSAD